MTEQQWLTTNQVTWLLSHAETVCSARKLALFQIECAQFLAVTIDVDPLLHDLLQHAEDAVEPEPDVGALADLLAVAQPHAQLTRRRLVRAVGDAGGKNRHTVRHLSQVAVVALLIQSVAVQENWWAWTTDVDPTEWPYYRAYEGIREAWCQQNTPLLRCIIGNPFRPVEFVPAWRTQTAVALATGIYAERAFDRLPILADALEEAGCDHLDILAHCRGPGPHARGCWVVDGVLGKQ